MRVSLVYYVFIYVVTGIVEYLCFFLNGDLMKITLENLISEILPIINFCMIFTKISFLFFGKSKLFFKR